jgi:Domain of unknown function (DUF4365)
MPRRPRQHVLEDLARALHRIFTQLGWTVEDLTKDYGEDLLIRIFSDGEATALAFFIQSKSTDTLVTKAREGDDYVPVRVSTDHLEHWRLFWQPVVLTLFDAASGITYWEVIQDITPSAKSGQTGVAKSVTVYVSCRNQLDSRGIRRLLSRTRNRFEQFKAQKAGAQILIEQLREILGLAIEYNPESGMLIVPKGKFLVDPEGGKSITMFGAWARRMTALSKTTGLPPDKAFAEAIRLAKEVMSAFDDGRALQVRSPQGDVKQEWKSSKEFLRFLKNRKDEEDEA